MNIAKDLISGPNKGGRNDGPSQVTVRPPPPPASNPPPAAKPPKKRRKPKKKARRRRKPKKQRPLLDLEGRRFPPEAKDVKAAVRRDVTGKDVPIVVDKGGRPYAVKDVEGAITILGGMGAIMATTKEAARVLRISEPTLFAFFKRFPPAREAYAGGKEEGKASLRRSQFNLAVKNATMAIFLGLNYLGQKDRREVVGARDAPPIKHEHEVTVKGELPDFSKMSEDDLAKFYREAIAAGSRAGG